MAAERNEVSLHEVEVYLALTSASSKWLTNAELATMVKTAKPRTVRAKTQKLVELGLVDQAEVFPGHRYRWSEKARQRNAGYLLRLDKAVEVFADHL